MATTARAAALALASAVLLPLAAAPLAHATTPATAPAAALSRSVPTGAGTGVLVSIDAGANDATAGWRADDGYTGGHATAPVTARPGTGLPAAVGATSRTGALVTYRLRHLDPGATYTVRTHHVEGSATKAGERVLDIDVNGRTAVTGLDVLAEAGAPGVPVHRDLPATADADGVVTVTFRGTTGDALVSGLQVIGHLPATRLGNRLQLQGLTITPTGPRTTHLSWTPVPGVAQYAVLRDGVVVGRTADAAYVDGGATPGARHRYTAAAVDTDGSLGLLVRARQVQMPAATPRATGAFHTEGTRIIDPQGRVFVPVGANLGARSTYDWAGPAAGHAADAKAWGWNTVRILVKPSWWDEDALRALVAEYRAAGLVVVLDAHDYWDADAPDADARRLRVRDMWHRLAPEFKNDSGVWFNLANEPGYLNDDWYDVTAELATIVRDAGAKNIIVADAPTWGQDLGNHAGYFTGARHAYEAPFAPTLAARFGDVVLGQHNYGARYDTTASYAAYVDAVQAQGLPLLSDEFGYTMDGSTTAGSYYLNKAGAKAVFAVNPGKGVGTIVWNGNTGDRYALTKDASAFYSGAARSELGDDLWALTH